MKFLIFFIGAVYAFAFVSYSEKSDISSLNPKPTEIVTCYPDDIREQSKLEASTREFAALHPEPAILRFKAVKGSGVSFATPDGGRGTGYEIKSNTKSRNYLLVIHEWYGLNDYIKKESERLSDELPGINVLALDLYDGKVATTADSAMKYMSGVNTQRLESIIKGAITYAGSDAKIYTIGWCFGGMWSLQASILAGRQAAGCVMYYGRPETNVTKLQQLNTDVIGFFGNLDKSITPEKVTEFEGNMKAAGKTLILYRYDAGHGFANPSNPVFNQLATDDARRKTLEYLRAKMAR